MFVYPTHLKSLLQEIFNFVYKKISEQGKQSSSNFLKYGKPYCLYRGPDGLKCAVGHLIDDELYEPEMEGAGVFSPGVYKSVLRSVKLLWPSLYSDKEADGFTIIEFLSLMQRAHDIQDWTLEAFQTEMKLYSEALNLEMPK